MTSLSYSTNIGAVEEYTDRVVTMIEVIAYDFGTTERRGMILDVTLYVSNEHL